MGKASLVIVMPAPLLSTRNMVPLACRVPTMTLFASTIRLQVEADRTPCPPDVTTKVQEVFEP